MTLIRSAQPVRDFDGHSFGAVGAPQRTFPDDSGPPAELLKGAPIPGVPDDVSIEFFLPEFPPSGRIGRISATGMPMPEAPMNEYRGMLFFKNDVGTAGQGTLVCLHVESH